MVDKASPRNATIRLFAAAHDWIPSCSSKMGQSVARYLQQLDSADWVGIVRGTEDQSLSPMLQKHSERSIEAPGAPFVWKYRKFDKAPAPGGASMWPRRVTTADRAFSRNQDQKQSLSVTNDSLKPFSLSILSR